MSHLVPVLVQTPAYSKVSAALTYSSAQPLEPGTLVRVPLGRREVLGVVWDGPAEPAAPAALRSITAALALPPLPAPWRALVDFAAQYYQRARGEVALAALPPQLRTLDATQLARRLQRKRPVSSSSTTADSAPPPSAEQQQALDQIAAEAGPFLLFGSTGSGKTEVYLQCAERLLAQDPLAQVLVLVPEINLTPQLLARFQARFGHQHGAKAVVCLHSGMSDAQRLRSWLAAHQGSARIVLGTRMAVFASLTRLRLVVVDEEHDPSYKQQEGARYSARDLAVLRAKHEGAKVLLGSATPSLESWHLSRPAAEGGRYLRLAMPSRIGAASLPRLRRVDMRQQPRGTLFSAPLLAAIQARVARGEQSMVLLNRRGYAPVLGCNHCDWKSACPHCSAFRVFHKSDRSLRCHHCGLAQAVPRACPDCGNQDLSTIGRGTERLEEQLAELLSKERRPDGRPVKLLRIDADSTRQQGALEQQLAQVHAGEVDVLVGTQMIAKGHDFRRITLVAALQPDSALFSSDFRAPERLFALLMQAGGRAGRDAAHSAASELWLQTEQPDHPLFVALRAHDYPAFAAQQLHERSQAGMPPFTYQALVRAEARSQAQAQDFLRACAQAASLLQPPGLEPTTLYPPLPMTIQRVANVERAQMLLENPSRAALQRFLAQWQALLQATRRLEAHKGVLRWAVDVDPVSL